MVVIMTQVVARRQVLSDIIVMAATAIGIHCAIGDSRFMSARIATTDDVAYDPTDFTAAAITTVTATVSTVLCSGSSIWVRFE